MATGETKQITGSLTLEDRYQTTIYDDILTISGATITLNDPAGEIFTDKGNDTVTVTDSTITNNSETEAELMFSMGSDNDSLTISNSTLNVNTFMGSGDDEVLVTGESQVTINKKFSLGSGNDILTISAILAGIGDLDFGDGINTLVFDGGKLVTTGTVSPLTNLSVTSQGGILAHNLTLSGTDMAISLSGNLTGDNSSRRITVGEGNVVLNTNSNIKTNVGFDLTNSIFTQSDSGSIELVNISGYAFVADSSSITLHDIIVNNTYGIKDTDGTVSLNQVDFSNNRTGLLLDGTILNGKDISFTSNVNGALKVSGTDTVLEKAYFVKNYRNTYASAYGGAIATATATADGYFIASATATAYGEAISTASAYGGAIANISGNLTFRNGDNNFSDNSVNASDTAAVRATATARATANSYFGATATATAYGEAISTVSAYGGAIANTSGDLTFRSGANIFSGNNVNAYAKTFAYATATAYVRATGTAYAPATATATAYGGAISTVSAYGGAIANTSGNLTFSNGDNNFSDNSVNANVTATATATSSDGYNGVASTIASACASAITTAYGGAIANISGDLTFSESTNHFSGNSVNASAFATASAEAHYAYDYAYVYASTTAYGGAIVNISGDLTFSGSVNHFSGNSVDAYAHTHTPEDAYSSSYATAYGGAIANISGDLTFSGSVNHFSGNSVDAYAHTYAPEDAYSSSYATAYGGAVANISGDLTFTGSANHFGDNSVNATATACNTAYATATAYGGAIANTSGGLTVSGSANHFSGNSVNTYAYAYAPDDTIGSACASAITTAYGGAIAANNSISNLTDVSFSGNNVNAYASARASDYNDVYTSATAVAYGGAIAANNSILNLTNVSFSGNNINATAIARASVSNNAYAYNARATAVAYGGAIAANNSILNLTNVSFSGNNVNAYANAYVSGLAYAARAYNNTAAYGGAVYISNSTLKYVIAENKYIENIDNNTQTGGFIYLDGVSEATFQIDGGLTVGNSSGMDSVAGSATSTIIKTGTGTWTIKSDISRFAGYWNVNEGILKLVRIARSITLDKWTFGVDAELHLSALNDRITMSVDKKIGTIDLGGGSDTINTGGYHLSDGLLRISTLTLTGGGKVSSGIITRTPGAEFDITLDNVTLSSNITGGNAADKITITQTSELSGITTLGNGANTIFASSGTKTTFSNTFSAGNDNDSLTFHQVIFEKSLELGDGANTFTATGEAQFSNIITGSGSDTFSLQNASFSGSVDLGDGTNTITATSASFCNGITGGSGNDSIKMTADSSISGVVDLGGGKNYVYTSKNLDFNDSFKMDANGETHLIVYNGASLTENSLTVYANENAERVTVNLDWSDIEGLDKVRILVSSDNTFETFEFTVELYNQTKAFTLNLEKGYFIQFQAQDEDGWSQRLLTDSDAPDQVSGFVMNRTTAEWAATHDNFGGNGVKKYNIQVASDVNFSSVIGTYTSTTNSYSFDSYADGNYFIRIQAEDYTGNKGEWSNIENLLIDNNAPSKVTVNTSALNSTVTANWDSATDSGSGVKEYNVEISASASFTTIEKSATVTGTDFSATDLSDGKYYIRVQAVDNVGNRGEWSSISSALVDTTAPGTASGIRTVNNAGVISLTWSTASDAGVGVQKYIIQYSTTSNFSTISGSETVTTTSCDIQNLNDGTYYFRVQAVDKNGNIGDWSSAISVMIDGTAPTVPAGLSVSTGEYSAILKWNASSDALSGVKEYEYIISADSNFSSTAFSGKTSDLSQSISNIGYGTYYYKVRAIDNYGNIGNWSNAESFAIADTTQPELTISGNPVNWTNQPVTLSANATDSESGIKTIEYSTDNQTWKIGSSISVNATGTVYFRATDNDGNVTAKSVSVTKIDTTDPVFEISRSTETLTNQDVVLGVTASDSASGIKAIQYSFDNSSWISGSTVNVDSNKTIYFRVTDNAGNVTEKSVVINNIDKVAPDKPIASADITTATNGKVTVSAEFSSDSVVREYSLNGKDWSAYEKGIDFFENGKVYFRGKDEAGHYSDVVEYTVGNIDTDAPVKPTAFADITSVTNQDVTVFATFSSDSAVKEYSLDNKVWRTYTAGVVMSDNGTVYFRSKDAAGNYSDVVEYAVDNIDTVADSISDKYVFISSKYTNKINGKKQNGITLIYGTNAFASLKDAGDTSGKTVILLDSKNSGEYVNQGTVASVVVIPTVKKTDNSYSYKANSAPKGTLNLNADTGSTEFIRFVSVNITGATVGNVTGGKCSSSEDIKSTVDKKGTVTDTGKSTYTANANGKLIAINSEVDTAKGYSAVTLTNSKITDLQGGNIKITSNNKSVDGKTKDQKISSSVNDNVAVGSVTLKAGAFADTVSGFSNVTLTDSTVGDITNFTSKDSKSETATYDEAKNTVTRKVTLSHIETTAGTLKATNVTEIGDVTGFATVTLKNVTGGADFSRLDEAGEKYSTVKETLNIKTNKDGSVTGTCSKTETFTRAGKFTATGSVVGDVENFSNVTLDGSAAGAVSNFETAKIVTNGTALWSDMYDYGRPEDYDLNLDAMDLKVTETKSLNGSVILKNHAYAESIESFQSVTMTGSDVGTISKATKVTVNKGDSSIDSYIGTDGNDTLNIAKGAVLTANQIDLGEEVKDTLAINGTLILTGTEVNAFKITGKGEIAAVSEVFADLDVAFANTLDVGETTENFRGTAYENADDSFKKAVKWDVKEEYNGWLGDWDGYTAGSDMADHIKFKADLGDELIVDGISDGNWTLLDKKGNQIINENIFANNEFQLAGDYILKLEYDSDNISQAYTITLA